MPDAGGAGAWNVTATVGGARAGFVVVDAACPAGAYRFSDDACLDCPGGAHCVQPGAELATLPAAPGRWRSSKFSTHFRRCPRADACPGGASANCARGYAGPLCAVCEDTHAPGLGYTCNICGEKWATAALAAPFFAGLFVIGLFMAAARRDVQTDFSSRRAVARAARARIAFVLAQLGVQLEAQLPRLRLPPAYRTYRPRRPRLVGSGVAANAAAAARRSSVDESRRTPRPRRADRPLTNRGGAAATASGVGTSASARFSPSTRTAASRARASRRRASTDGS